MAGLFSIICMALVLAFFYFCATWGARAPDPMAGAPPARPRVNQHTHEKALAAQISREKANLADARRATLANTSQEEHAALRAQWAEDDRGNERWYRDALRAAKQADRKEAGEI